MNASILVADDEVGMRDMLRWVLSAQGYQVTTVVDGREAIDLLRTSEFDVVFSDLRMPRASGLEVLRSAREIAPGTAVIIATGFADEGCALECLQEGAFDFIQKPFHTAAALASIARAVEHRRASRRGSREPFASARRR
jgi:DNA-binding NtrC family response regulator